MSKFHKNAVITGELDYFCLVCESHLKSDMDANRHIKEQPHIKNLESSCYMEKFKVDHIRKVKTGYYCEFCNLLLSTIAKMTLHIVNPVHTENKNKLELSRVGSKVLAFDFVIDESSWNGLIEDMCAVCNVEIIDKAAHMAEQTHILNLIKSKVEFGANGFIHRMVDENSYHCLTCKMIFAMNTLSTHHDNDNHKKKYQNNCNFSLPSFSENNFKEESKVTRKFFELDEEKYSEKEKIFGHLPEFQKKGVNLNFETETAFCTKCALNVDMNYIAIKTHIENHQGKSFKNESFETGHNIGDISVDVNHNITKAKVQENLINVLPPVCSTDIVLKQLEEQQKNENEDDVKPETATDKFKDILTYATENNLTYNKGNPNVYCRICNTRIPASLNNMKEHVGGAAHTKAKKLIEPKKVYVPKKPMKTFIKSGYHVYNFFCDDMVLNDKYCITRLSFLMITRTGSTNLRCQTCEMNLLLPEIENHLETPSHEVALEETRVVTNKEDEFIREVRPGLFHCGYCNLIAGSWDDLENHLKCEDHANHRFRANARLRSHLPGIEEERRRENFIMMRLLRHMHPFL